MMTEEQIIEAAIQGHASTRDAIRWAMNHVRKDAEPVAWMGVDIEGNPNKFRLNFFSGGIQLFASREDMELIETSDIAMIVSKAKAVLAAAEVKGL